MIKLEDNSVVLDGEIVQWDDILDLFRLQKQLLIQFGLLATVEECMYIWSGYSNDLAAGWLFFPANDEDILKQITSNPYFISFEHYIK